MTAPALLEQRPKRRPELLIGPRLTRGAVPIHVVKDPDSGRMHELGAREYFVLSRLDGEQTLEQIGDAYLETFHRRLGEGSWYQLLTLLANRRLLEGVPEPAADAAAAKAAAAESDDDAPGGKGRTWIQGTLMQGRVVFSDNPGPLIERAHLWLRPLLRPAVLAPVLAAVTGMEIYLATRLPDLSRDARNFFHQPQLAAIVMALLWCSVGLHELSHGLAGRHFGARPTEIGIKWLFPVNALYCRVEDVTLLRGPLPKMAIAAAGVLTNLVFLLPFFVLWLFLPPGDATGVALGAMLLFGSIEALANLIPIPPTDGYVLLGHGLRMSRLASESLRFVRSLAPAVARRAPFPRHYPRWTRWVYGGYTVLLVIMVSGVVTASQINFTHRVPEPYGRLVVPVLLLTMVTRYVGLRYRDQRAAERAAQAASAASQPAGPPGTVPQPAPATTAAVTGPARTEPPDRSDRLDVPAARPVPVHDPRPTEEEKHVTPIRAAAGPRAAVQLDGVTKRYGTLTAVDDVSLTVDRGEMFGVLGPNGAGKTTLIEMMEGLRNADAGTVSVLGLRPWPRNRALLPRVGVQSQAAAFFTRLTALEHLETVASLYRMPLAKAAEVLDQVGLSDKAGTRVEQLSGGQRQRLGIASALTHDPQLLFLDEPTAALDPQARRDLWRLLREIRDQGRTIVYTTHHLDEAEALCDRVAIMRGGRIIALDRPRALVDALDEPLRLLIPGGRISAEDARCITGVDSAVDEGDQLVIATRTLVPVLSAVSEQAGPDGIRTRAPSLEDVYFRLTGSEFTV